jgi:hypothetical protein
MDDLESRADGGSAGSNCLSDHRALSLAHRRGGLIHAQPSNGFRHDHSSDHIQVLLRSPHEQAGICGGPTPILSPGRIDAV